MSPCSGGTNTRDECTDKVLLFELPLMVESSESPPFQNKMCTRLKMDDMTGMEGVRRKDSMAAGERNHFSISPMGPILLFL